jgi:hypothetical protein
MHTHGVKKGKKGNFLGYHIDEWNLTNVGTLHAMESYELLNPFGSQKHTTKLYNYMKDMSWNITPKDFIEDKWVEDISMQIIHLIGLVFWENISSANNSFHVVALFFTPFCRGPTLEFGAMIDGLLSSMWQQSSPPSFPSLPSPTHLLLNQYL